MANFPEMYNDPQLLNYYTVKLCYFIFVVSVFVWFCLSELVHLIA